MEKRKIAVALKGGPMLTAFLDNPWVQVALVPLTLMIIGVFARRLGRRDGDGSPRRNDWAVNTTLLLMALGTVLGDLFAAASPSRGLYAWLFGLLATVYISIDYDRNRSWIRDDQGLPTDRKRIFVGIVVPDVLCFGIFGAYQAYKVGLLAGWL